MISRRELLTAGMAGGVVSAGEPLAAAPAVVQPEVDATRDVARAVVGVDSTLSRALLSNSVTFGLAAKLRGVFEVHFRTSHKFPDFVDIGYNVFMDVYDWHIKNRQPLQITRGPDGRYWLQFMFTTLILRAEQQPDYIGPPYDKA